MAQYAVPVADISKTDWSQRAGDGDGDAFDELDEGIDSGVPDDDTTAWQTGFLNNGETRTIECTLGSVTDPGVHTGHIFKIRARASGSTGVNRAGVIYVYQGTTLISTSDSTTFNLAYATKTHTISEAEAGNITDYTDLRIRAVFTWGTAGTARSIIITGMEAEFPDASAGTEYTQAAAGAVTPTGALAKRAGKPVSGAVTPTGALARLAAKIFAGSITPTGALAAVKTVLVSLAGSLAPSGALSRQTNKTTAGSITPSGGLVKSVSKSLAGALTPVGALVKQTGKALSGALTPEGGITKRIGKALTGVLNWVGTLATVLSGGTPVTDWVMLTLHPRTDDLTLDTRSLAFTVAARTDDLTLDARADDLTLYTRSAGLTVETRE